MVTCLGCNLAAPELGALCRPCAQKVAPCDGLIPDHVRSNIDAANAAAWLVDGFGNAHAVATTTRIGRQPAADFAILAPSISRDHAELACADERWTIRDLGSRNGTFVDDDRAQGRVPLARHRMGRAPLIKLGDVLLWFVTEVAERPVNAPMMATGGGGLVRYLLAHGDAELCLVGGGDPGAGGALLSRAVGAAAWTEHGLAPLEFQLLRALCVRAHAEASAPSAVRGCVPTRQLARDLPFQSRYANEENVRQVVRRVRGVLAEAGADGVLAVAPGRGYYVVSPVTIAAPASPGPRSS
jgi:hypothetical protein